MCICNDVHVILCYDSSTLMRLMILFPVINFHSLSTLLPFAVINPISLNCSKSDPMMSAASHMSIIYCKF